MYMKKQQTLLHYALSRIDTNEMTHTTMPIRRVLQTKTNTDATTHKSKKSK